MRTTTLALCAALALLLAVPQAHAATTETKLRQQVAALKRSNAIVRAQLAGARRIVKARDARIVTLTAERDQARTDLATAQAAIVADLKAKVATLTNSELYSLALDMVVALEDDCTYSGDITTVPGAGGSATFTRISGGCF